MADHQSNSKVNLLMVAQSGAGKTGMLAPLIDAGLKIHALDFDNGLSVLKGYVKNRDLLNKNVSFVELGDEFKMQNQRVAVTKATSWQIAMDALDKGTPFAPDVPPFKEWGPDRVLLLDSLPIAAKSALYMVMVANARGAQAPHQSDYGTAMDSVERFLDMICASTVKCHVIVNTHPVVVEGTTTVLPEALGSKLPPKVGKKFDNMLAINISATGKRMIQTKRDGLFALKSAVPLNSEYPLETGLLDIFKALTGKDKLV